MLARSALFAAALVLVTPVYALIALATFPLPRMARYRVISGWSRLMVFLSETILGIHWKVEGRENLPGRPAVILSKHQSAWETMAFQVIFPPQVHVLKRELLWIPFFGWGLALMSPIAIDRSRGTAALRSIARRGRERLEQGFWVVVFPEGTRVAPGTTRKYGVSGAALAQEAGVLIVPVAHNAGDFWPRRSVIKRPGLIRLCIGPPIAPGSLPPREINLVVQEWIESKMREISTAYEQPKQVPGP